MQALITRSRDNTDSYCSLTILQSYEDENIVYFNKLID